MSITKHNAPDDIFDPQFPELRQPELGQSNHNHNQTMTKHIALDIETVSLPREILLKNAPEFTAPSNYKDPAKIAEYISAARQRWLDDAALSSMTGRVAIIGTLDMETEEWRGYVIRHPEDEKAALERFWAEVFCSGKVGSVTGWAISGFDLPFLIQRSFVHRLRVPMPALFRGNYFDRDRVVDLQDIWACFSRSKAGLTLADVARACGAGEKSGDGADFARLWETDQDAAVAYCKQDCMLVKQLSRNIRFA